MRAIEGGEGEGEVTKGGCWMGGEAAVGEGVMGADMARWLWRLGWVVVGGVGV